MLAGSATLAAFGSTVGQRQGRRSRSSSSALMRAAEQQDCADNEERERPGALTELGEVVGDDLGHGSPAARRTPSQSAPAQVSGRLARESPAEHRGPLASCSVAAVLTAA